MGTIIQKVGYLYNTKDGSVLTLYAMYESIKSNPKLIYFSYIFTTLLACNLYLSYTLLQTASLLHTTMYFMTA